MGRDVGPQFGVSDGADYSQGQTCRARSARRCARSLSACPGGRNAVLGAQDAARRAAARFRAWAGARRAVGRCENPCGEPAQGGSRGYRSAIELSGRARVDSDLREGHARLLRRDEEWLEGQASRLVDFQLRAARLPAYRWQGRKRNRQRSRPERAGTDLAHDPRHRETRATARRNRAGLCAHQEAGAGGSLATLGDARPATPDAAGHASGGDAARERTRVS